MEFTFRSPIFSIAIDNLMKSVDTSGHFLVVFQVVTKPCEHKKQISELTLEEGNVNSSQKRKRNHKG